MSNYKQPSVIGGACIVASVCVGAGMLALPAAGSGVWTFGAILAMVVTMLVMTFSGFLLLEAFQHYDRHVSFSSVCRDLMGNVYNTFNNLSVYFVGGILLYVYSTVMGDIFSHILPINMQLASILAVLIFSFPVWLSTRFVDRVSVLLVVFMAVSFVAGVFSLIGQIKLDTLLNSAAGEISYTPYIWAFFPVVLTSFGYHHSVASMRIYYRDERKAQYAILGGTLIALALYTLWVVSIFGNLPRANFVEVVQKGGQVSALLEALGGAVESEQVSIIFQAFTVGAVVSSFIGVGLGVFDYLADLFAINNTRSARSLTWALTFLPPLVFSLCAPFGFTIAIAYAGAVATIWTCLTPALLAWRARRKFGLEAMKYRVPYATTVMIIVFLFGVMVAVLHFMDMWHLLPVFGQTS